MTSSIQKSSGEGLGQIIGTVIELNIDIWKYNPLAGSSYIALTKELNHPRKVLISI